MKTNYLKILIIVSVFFMGCSVKKGMITIEDLSAEKILIIGVIEYDYTQLKSSITTDIQIFIESEEDVSNFYLSEEYLPDVAFKKHQYISILGDTGIYDLCLHRIKTSTSETDDLLNLMDKERNFISSEQNTLKRLLLYNGKIINLGKIIVKFNSGNVEESNNAYTYTVHSDDNDTIGIHAFKETYPLIYDRYQNDIYVIRNKLNECIEYVLNNISEDKNLRLRSYIKDHPDRIEYIFKNLTIETQERFAKDIDQFTFEELEDFLNKIE